MRPAPAMIHPRASPSALPKRKGSGRTRFLTHCSGRKETKSALSGRIVEYPASEACSPEDLAAISHIVMAFKLGPARIMKASPDNSRTPGRHTRISLRDEQSVAPGWHDAEIHLVPARDFSSGRGRPTTAMPGASQRRSDEVSGGKDPRDGRSRS